MQLRIAHTLHVILQKLYANEDGQDLVEYILLFMLIVVAAIIGITAFGNSVRELYDSVIGTF